MFGMKKDVNKELIKFSKKGNVEKVRTLIQSGAEINYRDKKSWTALHWASAQGRVEVSELLLAEGSELNAVNNVGLTPLHMASWHGQKETVAYLLSNEVNVNIVNPDGITPLHIAARGLEMGDEGKHQIATVELLIELGGSITSKDVAGCTPLHSAAGSSRERSKVIRLLIENGADIDAQQMDGATPLHFAAQMGNSDNVWTLLYIGADRNIRTNEGKTAKQVAKMSCIQCF